MIEGSSGRATLGHCRNSHRCCWHWGCHDPIDKFTYELDNGFQKVSETMLAIQKQIDSLAAVMLQNRWGLDVLTAKESGLCLFLQEECRFYGNQSGIVRNKTQELQSDMQNFKEREASSSWTFENPIWKWRLPFVTPFLVIFLELLFTPCHINLISTFLQRQIQNISNQTTNQFLLQDYQLLSTEGPDANIYQEEPDGENQWYPDIDDTPRQ